VNAFLNSGFFFVATSLVVLVAIFVFDKLIKYKVWEEINNGNMAVALAVGGVVVGVANIMRCAISANDSVLRTIIWGGFGTTLLLIVYFAFELFTPKLNVTDEIAKGNKAVGWISFIFSLAFSFIIGASIS